MRRKGSLDDRQKLNRFFFKDNGWYVEIRNGVKGPFPRREDAAHFLQRYVHDKRVQKARSVSGDDLALSQVIVQSDSSLGVE